MKTKLIFVGISIVVVVAVAYFTTKTSKLPEAESGFSVSVFADKLD